MMREDWRQRSSGAKTKQTIAAMSPDDEHLDPKPNPYTLNLNPKPLNLLRDCPFPSIDTGDIFNYFDVCILQVLEINRCGFLVTSILTLLNCGVQ